MTVNSETDMTALSQRWGPATLRLQVCGV